MDRRLSFGKHLKIATAKVIHCGANLARLMPNICGPRQAKRRQVASVVHSKLLYAALVWANALQNHAIRRKLFSAQRSVALRIVSAYRTVSTSAVLVLASVPPIDLLAEERQETFQLRKKLTCTDLQEIARAKDHPFLDSGRLLSHDLRHQCLPFNLLRIRLYSLNPNYSPKYTNSLKRNSYSPGCSDRLASFNCLEYVLPLFRDLLNFLI